MNWEIEVFEDIVTEMLETYKNKNQNYGNSFSEIYAQLGPTAGLVPLFNKIHRAKSLIANEQENHYESLEDTFLDLACYAVMNLIEIKRKKNNQNETTDERCLL